MRVLHVVGGIASPVAAFLLPSFTICPPLSRVQVCPACVPHQTIRKRVQGLNSPRSAALEARRGQEDERGGLDDEGDEFGALEKVISTFNIPVQVGPLSIRLLFLIALDIAVLRGDWLFTAGFLGWLALGRTTGLPDSAALAAAILTTGALQAPLASLVTAVGGNQISLPSGMLALAITAVAVVGAQQQQLVRQQQDEEDEDEERVPIKSKPKRRLKPGYGDLRDFDARLKGKSASKSSADKGFDTRE